MALRINLYHEIHRARKEERYDPLKISFMCLGLVAAGLAGVYFMKLSETNDIREQALSHQAELRRLDPLSANAKLDEAEITKKLALSKNLTSRIESRFYWAPVWDMIAGTIPGNVQVTKLVGDATNFDGPNRRIGMSVDGIAAGEKPRKVAEDLRLALQDTLSRKFKNASVTFRTLDDSNEQVKVDGRSQRTALFSLTVSFTSAASENTPEEPKTAGL